MTPPKGLCECGCGRPTTVAKATTRARGWVKGEPLRYVLGHNPLTGTGKRYREGEFKGERSYEHRRIVEQAMGKPLPPGAEVHHVNENKRDNRHCNLIACQDVAYHALLHKRQRALIACGHPDWRRCRFCKQWGPPTEMEHRQWMSAHPQCRRDYVNTTRARRLSAQREAAA